MLCRPSTRTRALLLCMLLTVLWIADCWESSNPPSLKTAEPHEIEPDVAAEAAIGNKLPPRATIRKRILTRYRTFGVIVRPPHKLLTAFTILRSRSKVQLTKPLIATSRFFRKIQKNKFHFLISKCRSHTK